MHLVREHFAGRQGAQRKNAPTKGGPDLAQVGTLVDYRCGASADRSAKTDLFYQARFEPQASS